MENKILEEHLKFECKRKEETIKKSKVRIIIDICMGLMLIALKIIIGMVDMSLTNRGVNIGYTEINPLINFFGLNSMFILNVISITVLFWLGVWVIINLPEYFKYYLYALWFVVLLGFLGNLWNYSIIIL